MITINVHDPVLSASVSHGTKASWVAITFETAKDRIELVCFSRDAAYVENLAKAINAVTPAPVEKVS